MRTPLIEPIARRMAEATPRHASLTTQGGAAN